VLALHQHPKADCPIGGHIRQTLGNVFDEAQQALELSLDKVSVANVLENTQRENNQL
jgi:hypothetical protein